MQGQFSGRMQIIQIMQMARHAAWAADKESCPSVGKKMFVSFDLCRIVKEDTDTQIWKSRFTIQTRSGYHDMAPDV